MVAHRQARIDPRLRGREEQLLEAAGLGPGERLVAHLAVGRSSPQVLGLLEQAGGLGRAPTGELAAAFRHQAFEPEDVGYLGGDVQHVPRGAGDDHVSRHAGVAQPFAHPRDGRPQRDLGAAASVVTRQGVHQAVDRDDEAAVDEEAGHQRPGLHTADIDGPAIPHDLDGAEDADLEGDRGRSRPLPGIGPLHASPPRPLPWSLDARPVLQPSLGHGGRRARRHRGAADSSTTSPGCPCGKAASMHSPPVTKSLFVGVTLRCRSVARFRRPAGERPSGRQRRQAHEERLQQQRLVRVAGSASAVSVISPTAATALRTSSSATTTVCRRCRAGHPTAVGPGQHAEPRPQCVGAEAALLPLVLLDDLLAPGRARVRPSPWPPRSATRSLVRAAARSGSTARSADSSTRRVRPAAVMPDAVSSSGTDVHSATRAATSGSSTMTRARSGLPPLLSATTAAMSGGTPDRRRANAPGPPGAPAGTAISTHRLATVTRSGVTSSASNTKTVSPAAPRAS